MNNGVEKYKSDIDADKNTDLNIAIYENYNHKREICVPQNIYKYKNFRCDDLNERIIENFLKYIWSWNSMVPSYINNGEESLVRSRTSEHKNSSGKQ